LDLDALLDGLSDIRAEEAGEEAEDDPSVEHEDDSVQSSDVSSTDNGGGEAGGDGHESASASVPPGMVAVGDDFISEQEARALLDLNRQVKEDPAKAAAIAAALGGHVPTQEAPAPVQSDALPEWIDPDDATAVAQHRETQELRSELARIREAEQRREAEFRTQQEQSRRGQVVDAWRDAVATFRTAHPDFDEADIKVLADRAAGLGMLANPEAVGGSLRGGFEIALDAALWATPQYRERAMSGATVPSKQEQSASRKQKASALSSTSGSSPRTQSTEATPTTRSEVMQAGLAFLREGAGVSE
jgi:hypothetical protein